MLLKKRDLQLIASTDLTCIKNGINLHDAVESAITGGASTILMRDDTLSEEEYLKESARIMNIPEGVEDEGLPFN